MAEFAEAGDADNLSLLCSEYAQLSATLSATSAQTASEANQVEGLIYEIIDNQRRISEFAEPWLMHVKKLLRENRQEKSLMDTYRASS